MQGPQIYHPPSDFHYSELRVFALACCQSKLPVVEPMILVLNPSSPRSYTTVGLTYTIRVRPTAVFGGPRWGWHVLLRPFYGVVSFPVHFPVCVPGT